METIKIQELARGVHVGHSWTNLSNTNTWPVGQHHTTGGGGGGKDDVE